VYRITTLTTHAASKPQKELKLKQFVNFRIVSDAINCLEHTHDKVRNTMFTRINSPLRANKQPHEMRDVPRATAAHARGFRLVKEIPEHILADVS